MSPLIVYRIYTNSIDSQGAPSLSTVPISLYSIPVILGAISEIFVNVTAYAIAYSRSPKNMKGLVSSINLFMTAISAAIGLATAPAIQDPYLTWAFAGPTIAGAVLTVIFWFTFKHIDQEEFVINTGFGDMRRDSDRDSDAEGGHVAPLEEKKVASPSPPVTEEKK